MVVPGSHHKLKIFCPILSSSYRRHLPGPLRAPATLESHMASVAQLNANRLNAQRSTGPRSEEGKAVSRFNALTYGIEARSRVIPGEDPAELEALAGDYQRQLNPQGPLEGYLVETIVAADWNRRRYTRVEAQLYRVLMAAAAAPAESGALPGPAAAFADDVTGARILQSVFRRLASAERSYFRALTELRRIKKEERNQPEADQPLKPEGISRSDSPQTGGIGFVPPVSCPAAWTPTLDPGPQVSTPISNAFGRFPNGEPLAVRR
jgi:hypothetical protein